MRRLLIATALFMALVASYLFIAENRERSMRVDVQQQIQRLADSVDRLTRIMERVLKERELSNPTELYSEWHSAGSPPVLRSVTTTRMEGETVRSWEERHDAAVASLRTTFPPV